MELRNLTGYADHWRLLAEYGHRSSNNFMAEFKLPRAGGHPITVRARRRIPNDIIPLEPFAMALLDPVLLQHLNSFCKSCNRYFESWCLAVIRWICNALHSLTAMILHSAVKRLAHAYDATVPQPEVRVSQAFHNRQYTSSYTEAMRGLALGLSRCDVL